MKKLLAVFMVVLIAVLVLAGCGYDDTARQQVRLEQQQQSLGVKAIVENQPVPDLGGYSFERQIVIDTYLARNNTVSTYTYWFTYDGKIIEICSSIGYPIPYSTQLTNPMAPLSTTYDASVLPNPELNSLYVPADTAATLVQCVNPDGSVSPSYIEENVQAFPFRIKSDFQLERIGNSSFSVKVKK